MRKPWDPVAPSEDRNVWLTFPRLNMSPVEFKNIEDDECRKIRSLSGSKLFKYAEHVTNSSLPINRSFGFYYFLFCRLKSKQRHDNSGAEAMVKTLKSILLCLRSRLLGMIHSQYGIKRVRPIILAEWESMKGTSNRVGMATLKEIMSGDITTSEGGFQMTNFGLSF